MMVFTQRWVLDVGKEGTVALQGWLLSITDIVPHGVQAGERGDRSEVHLINKQSTCRA